ncbi:MAG: DUF1549 and DUF1553 domain-containing protein [Planctomycetota bacterium]|nr:DUF1549 and DUF1553 domain-containing protein [Planctomycetota bacterium]
MTLMPAARLSIHRRPNSPATIIFFCLVSVAGALSVAVRAAPPSVQVTEAELSDSDRDHWAFRPLRRSTTAPSHSPHARNTIDSWIAHHWRRHNLQATPPALPHTYFRRLSYDLRGLPPTPRELETWSANQAPDGAARVVDQMLASPSYGEHVAQHWLDLARFAETDGFEFDHPRKQAWRYRDWVIDALNADLPYDQFIAYQVAGDELQPGDPQAQIATAFCLSGPDMPDINSQQERLHNVLNELTGTVGSVLLGLQIGCAQCHDHKYDPISQADFYRFRAIFEPAVSVKRNQSLSLLTETGSTPVSHLMVRGDWRRPGPTVQPAFPRIANPGDIACAAPSSGNTTGRRLALARWLADSTNPLTARVMVNRIWQSHFGHGLSRTSSDFGTIGDPPSHPELLDWLAGEFVARKWSVKQLRRLIVTSATYRQSRHRGAPTSDPEHVWLAGFPRRRLSGEALRDAMLAASDSLSSARGGLGIMAPLPPELLQTLLKNQWKVAPRRGDHYRRSIYLFARRNLRYPIFEAFDRPDGNASCARRSQSTTAPQSLVLLNSRFSLDAARRLAGTLLRERTRVDDTCYQELFRRVYARPAAPDESKVLAAFYQRQTDLLRAAGRAPEQLAMPIPRPAHLAPAAAAAFTDVCLAAFNANEFLYLD